jgi:hypothetical protein
VTARLFLNGQRYQQEMFAWVRTGVGAEGDATRFLPQHAWHALLFCALSAATGSIASMPMGAALVHYMGQYVGAPGSPPLALVSWLTPS